MGWQIMPGGPFEVGRAHRSGHTARVRGQLVGIPPVAGDSELPAGTGRASRWAWGVWASTSIMAALHATVLVARGIELGPDILNYQLLYERIGSCHCAPSDVALEPLWTLLTLAGHVLGLAFSSWLAAILVAQSLLWMLVGLIGAGLVGVPPDFALLTLPITLLMVQTYPFFVAGQSNILRSGLATPLGALAGLLLLRGRWLLALALLASAIGIHTEVGLILGVGLAALAVISRRLAIGVFSALSVVYAAGLSTALADWLVPASLLQSGLEYGSGADYRSGVRLDFLAFTVAQLALVTFLSRGDRPGGLGSGSVSWLTGLAVPFLLVGGVATYSDRWLQPYWMIAPLLAAVMLFRRAPSALQFWLGIGALAASVVVTAAQASI